MERVGANYCSDGQKAYKRFAGVRAVRVRPTAERKGNKGRKRYAGLKPGPYKAILRVLGDV